MFEDEIEQKKLLIKKFNNMRGKALLLKSQAMQMCPQDFLKKVCL